MHDCVCVQAHTMYVCMYMRLCAHPTLHVCLHLVLVTEVARVEEGQCIGADHVSRVVAQDDAHPVHQSRAKGCNIS